jgi:hypothetical protein
MVQVLKLGEFPICRLDKIFYGFFTDFSALVLNPISLNVVMIVYSSCGELVSLDMSPSEFLEYAPGPASGEKD